MSNDLKEYIKGVIKVIAIILVAIALLGLFSCSTKQKAIDYSYEKDSLLSEYLHSVSSLIADCNFGSVTKITYYDTSLPIDESTGKHPEAIVIERRDSSVVNVTKTDTISYSQIEDVKEKESYSKIVTKESDIGYKFLSIYIFLVIVFLLYVWIVRKRLF